MDQIEGFREYLGVAEEDRLNALNPPEKTPELFENFLPYAVALDCQNAWAAKFAGVLAAAGTAAAAAAWYVGSRDWGSDPVSFADHLGSDLSSTICVVVDRARLQRRWRRRQQRRRLLRRWRRWRRRRRLVTGNSFHLDFSRPTTRTRKRETTFMATMRLATSCGPVVGDRRGGVARTGVCAGSREGVLRRQDRADDRRLRHRRRLRRVLAHDRALSRQDAGHDRHRREPARRRRAHRAQPPVHRDARRSADLAVERHQRRLRAAHRRPGRALRPRQVQLSRDRRRAARALAGGAGFSHQGSAAGGRRQDEVALGVVGRDLRARHRRRLHLRGAQARLPCRAGLQGQRGRRPCGDARRDGRALCAGILRQQFRPQPSRTGRWRRSRAPSRASSRTGRPSSRRPRWMPTRPG